MKTILCFLGILLSLFGANSNLIMKTAHKIENKADCEQKTELVAEIMAVGETTEPPQIALSLPFKIFDKPFKFTDLFSILSSLILPDGNIINDIDLKTAGTAEFTAKYNAILDIFDTGFYPLLQKHLLDIDAQFEYVLTEGLNIKGEGKIRDLLHNIAPDLIAFLQWYTNAAYAEVLEKHSIFLSFYNTILKPLNLTLEGISPEFWYLIQSYIVKNYDQIMDKNNMVLLFLQYLLSPINSDLKEIIGKQYGTDSTRWFYHHAKTNFDSLIFHLLTGYKSNTEDENKYVLKLVGYLQTPFLIYLYFDDLVDQNFIGNQADLGMFNLKGNVSLKLEPTLLLASILNVFSQNNGQGIDVVKDNFLIASTWKGINSTVTNSISGIAVFFGSIIMALAGEDILYNLKINKKEIENNQIEMIAGTVQLMLKNQDGIWEPLRTTIQNDDFYFSNILVAVDFKFSFKNVDFKMMAKEEPNIFYNKNKKFIFDLRLSKEV